MKHSIFYIIIAVLTISCSDDKVTNTNDGDLNQISYKKDNSIKGSIPEQMEIKKVFSGERKAETLADLEILYKKDTNTSQGTDYDTNLKNMWLILIYKRLLNDEGTEEQKKYFINEQLKLEHNLPHLENFVNLLFETKSLSNEDRDSFFEKFVDINTKAINQIVWKTPKEKEEKLQELVLIRRNYGLLTSY